MRELPTGTVTLLFTDIEGSTRLLQELGSDYAAALAEHRERLAHEACEREPAALAAGRELDLEKALQLALCRR